jgi:probable phosphoglycerate mutase
MRLFLLARHGQSLFNIDGVVNGDPALDRGLSEQGIEEAERLGGEIAGVRIDLAVVSPFPRAQQTANIALGGREVPHLVEDDLGDVRVGELEGATLDVYRAAPAHTNRKERFPGGESLDEAALRYAAVFERLLAREEKTMLIVCHEIPVRYVVNAAAGSDDLNGPTRSIANATAYLFDDESLGRAVERVRAIASRP